MTGPGMNPPAGDRNRKVELGGADAVPDTPHTAKAQGAELTDEERRRTPRVTPAATATSGMKPVVYIVIALIAIAAAYLFLGT